MRRGQLAVASLVVAAARLCGASVCAQDNEPSGWAAYETNRAAAVGADVHWEKLARVKTDEGPMLVQESSLTAEQAAQLNETAALAYAKLSQEDTWAATVAWPYLVTAARLSANDLFTRLGAERDHARSQVAADASGYMAMRATNAGRIMEWLQALYAQGVREAPVVGMGLEPMPNPRYDRGGQHVPPTSFVGHGSWMECQYNPERMNAYAWFMRALLGRLADETQDVDSAKRSVTQAAVLYRVYGRYERKDDADWLAEELRRRVPAIIADGVKGWVAEAMSAPLSFPPTQKELGYGG